MTIEKQAAVVERKLLKRRLTAGELAERAGYDSGRSIARALGVLTAEGRAIQYPGRFPTYTKVA